MTSIAFNGGSVGEKVFNLPGGETTYTVKVIAVADTNSSAVAEKTFTKDGTVALPEFIYEGNNADFKLSNTINFVSATEDVTFHYTTDGTLPTKATPTKINSRNFYGSSIGTSNFNLTTDGITTVKVIAVVGNEISAVATKEFTSNEMKVTLSVSVTGSGSIWSGGSRVSDDHVVTKGAQVSLEAVPFSDNFEFTKWTGDIDSVTISDPTITILMDSDKSISAGFKTVVAETPVIRSSTGLDNFTDELTVTITSVSPKAKIEYTLNGESKTSTSNSVEFLITETTIVRAQAKIGTVASETEAIATFTKIVTIDLEEILISGTNLSMGKYEVTQGEYYDLMTNLTDSTGVGNRKPSDFTGENWRELPVENVNWYDAVNFCNALSESAGFTKYYTINGTAVTIASGSGLGYRLPTEAEWIYVAGGESHTYSGSDTIGDVAWYSDNSGNKTHTVGKKKTSGQNGHSGANDYGLYDMSGNVGEWCWDTLSSGSSERILRGGSWGDSVDSHFCEVDSFNSATPSTASSFYGFRVARSVGP